MSHPRQTLRRILVSVVCALASLTLLAYGLSSRGARLPRWGGRFAAVALAYVAFRWGYWRREEPPSGEGRATPTHTRRRRHEDTPQ